MSAKGNIYNDLNMISYGDIALSANNIDNASRKIKAVGDVTLTAAGNVSNSRGEISSETGDITINAGGTVDNYYGQLLSGSDIALKANRLNNDYGRVAAYGNIDLALTGISTATVVPSFPRRVISNWLPTPLITTTV